jgi:hypothetical protein
MTLKFTRPAIALAIALSLAGCGGKASFPVNGTVTGQIYSPLVLSTNGMDLTVNAPATPTATTSAAFSFPNSLSYGDAYDVAIKANPPHQTCVVVQGGADSAGHLASINVSVSCALTPLAIGGTITGLTSAGLVLTNGSAGGTVTAVPDTTTPGADVPFTFATLVEFGVSYGVTVLTQPDTQTCSVSPNGTGVMGDTAVTGTVGIVVTCGPKT